ncbi:hypothetical protein B9T36_10840 [Acinetobacter sp. ANC 4204]|uniref:hypothetical protein n=1 Tax=Acinetobacter sp. ANC 4204 TaxID=1977884 RepID=UPI000A358FCA|nr:hypothetical protein [Acinetobacter sp. ANC 4204]OTG58825.1 hypothetical protein B9T36_10840 [Acinetobacter sp. ANC 4204]
MAKKLLGFVLIHPEKEDFVIGINNGDAMITTLYDSRPDNAKRFKDFGEIEKFVSPLDDFLLDVAKLYDTGKQYLVEYETSVSSRPIESD